MDQDTGTLVRWIKQPGEMVAQGEPIMEIETDKALVEVEATASGVLGNVTAFEGDEIPVGQVIARILDADEVPRRAEVQQQNTSQPLGERELAEADSNLPAPQVERSASTIEARPEPTPAPGTSFRPGNSPERGGRVLASPRARRIASEMGINLAALNGTGPDGAVLAADVLTGDPIAAATTQSELDERHFATGPSTPDLVPARDVAVSGRWRVMAERMAASWTTAPHFFLMREVVASELVELRTRLLPLVERRVGVRLTYTDLLVKVLAATLAKHPRLLGAWDGASIRAWDEINIGIATDTGETLVVPVIHGADALSIGDVAARRAELVERATDGRLALDDLARATFTLTNLGAYGVDAFNAIINPPQAAILAVGRIADRVVAIDGAPAVRPTIVISLSCDHRVVDGARGARFLDDLASLIEEPWGLLA
jgi:pyruvate dehydrogenase E2 component (dihydrolipoamide acetyltransferase)